jgi:KaiC/GvpD/RAD55 family RecA-like ATPase
MDEWWKKMQKLSAGNEQFDDLFFGGIRFGFQMLVSGPAGIGKEEFLNSFIAANLKKGAPFLVVLLDRSPAQQREELQWVAPDAVGEFEKDGLLRYIDAFSAHAGVVEPTEDPSVVRLPASEDFDAILGAVNRVDKPYMQLVVRSLSDCLTFSGLKKTLRFVRCLSAWARQQGRVCLYDFDRSCHTDLEVNNIARLTDGTIEFHEEGGKHFFNVRGVGDIQKSAGVAFEHTRRGLKLAPLGTELVDKIK